MKHSEEPGFDDIKADDEIEFDNSIGEPIDYDENKESTVKLHKKIWNRGPLSKKEKVLLIIGGIILIAGVSFIVYSLTKQHKPTAIKHVSVIINKPPPVIKSKLSGLPVTAAQAAMPLTAVMIENSDQARPQSGLSQAGVVYEAIAEAGITRFLALFEEGNPSSIGPIRSARPYYIDQAQPFDAAYVHVGGSPDALNALQSNGVKNLDEFANGSSFIRATNRDAPHNVYTSMTSLLSLEASKGYDKSNFTGYARKIDMPAKTPTATKIDLNISSPDFAVHYDYNKTNNSYLRSEAGVSMVDMNTGKQLEPKVVIALVIPTSQGALDASGAYYTDYADIGSGKAYIFQDGTVTIGTWSKSSSTSQLLLGDANGSPIAINAGQTWITALGNSNLISYINN